MNVFIQTALCASAYAAEHIAVHFTSHLQDPQKTKYQVQSLYLTERYIDSHEKVFWAQQTSN